MLTVLVHFYLYTNYFKANVVHLKCTCHKLKQLLSMLIVMSLKILNL